MDPTVRKRKPWLRDGSYRTEAEDVWHWPVFVGSLKWVLHAWQQRDQTGVTHVLDLHHPLLVGEAVHVTAEVLPRHKYSQRLGENTIASVQYAMSHAPHLMDDLSQVSYNTVSAYVQKRQHLLVINTFCIHLPHWATAQIHTVNKGTLQWTDGHPCYTVHHPHLLAVAGNAAEVAVELVGPLQAVVRVVVCCCEGVHVLR